MRPSTRSTTRTMGAMFVALAVVFLFWHLVLYWALHPAMTWGQVLEAKQERARGGVGLLLWGLLAQIVPRLCREKAVVGDETMYRIRKRGRRID